jgi:transposase
MIVTDRAAEETGGDWKQTLEKYRAQDKRTEPYSPWQNRAEHEIRELKKRLGRFYTQARHCLECGALPWNWRPRFGGTLSMI